MEKFIKTEIQYPFLTEPVLVYERECGHKIVIAHKQGEMVNISSWVKTGSINEDDDITGISHFLEHLMFKGTNRHPAGDFDRFLEAKGAIVNAATWKDYTFYYVTLPKGKDDVNLYETIELHADMMLDPIFPEHEIGPVFDLNDASVSQKRERHVVTEEIRMRMDQPWTKVYNALNFNMYRKHPYKRDVIGTPEVIASVTRDTINNYYQKYYTPNNIVTIVVGDFDTDAVLQFISEKFDFKNRKNTPVGVYEKDAPPESTQYIENYADVNTAFMMVGYLGAEAKNLKEAIILDIISIALGEGQSSRLYQNLIEKVQNPIFNIVSSTYYHFRDGGNFFVQANFNHDKKDEAITAINSEIEKLISDGLQQREFNKAKKKLKSTFAESSETVSDIADTIGYYMSVCDNLRLVNDYLAVLDSVTLADIQTAAKKYLNLNKATISVLLPR